VAAYKKKIVAFSVAVALACSALVVCAAQSTTDESGEPLFEESGRLFANDPNLLMKSVESTGFRELFFRVILSVLLVVVLGVAAIYVSKKFLPRITNLAGKEIRIIETVHLGQHKRVHLMKIGNQRLLIGSTNESITKLADVTDALSKVALSSQEIDND